MRDFTGKNCTTLDTLAYHHWLLTFSSLSIIEITTWACGKSTCAALLQAPLPARLLFHRCYTGWSISRGDWPPLVPLRVSLDVAWKKKKRASTKDRWLDGISNVQETFILRTLLLPVFGFRMITDIKVISPVVVQRVYWYFLCTLFFSASPGLFYYLK